MITTEEMIKLQAMIHTVKIMRDSPFADMFGFEWIIEEVHKIFGKEDLKKSA